MIMSAKLHADPKADAAMRRDLKTLARFIACFCRYRHRGAPKSPVCLTTHDVEAIHGGPLSLCPSCRRLLAHAFVKRSRCPFDPKPMCKKCPNHCYAPAYAEQMREVMKYSGRRLVLSGRVDYLLHLIG